MPQQSSRTRRSGAAGAEKLAAPGERAAPRPDDRKPAAAEEQAVFAKVKRAVLQVVPHLPPRKVRPEATLSDVEIDSLKVVELTLALEDVFGQPVFLPDWIGQVDHPRDLTMGSLVAHLQRGLPRVG